MNIVRISNTFKSIVDGSQGRIAAYHAGYHQDINANVENAYNADGAKGKSFPLLMWALPIEGEVSMKSGHGSDTMQVDLYLYDLQGYDMQGNPTTTTTVEAWDKLKRVMFEVLTAIQKTDGIKVLDGRFKYFTDSSLHNDRLLCVGATFLIYDPFGCADYEGVPPFNPLPVTNTITEAEYIP